MRICYCWCARGISGNVVFIKCWNRCRDRYHFDLDPCVLFVCVMIYGIP